MGIGGAVIIFVMMASMIVFFSLYGIVRLVYFTFRLKWTEDINNLVTTVLVLLIMLAIVVGGFLIN